MKKKRKRRHFRISSFFKILFLLIIMVGVSVSAIAATSLVSVLKKAPPVEPKKYRDKLFETSRVYDSNENLLQALVKDEFAEFVSIEKIPDNLKNAVISVEDERFFNHSAVDFKRLLGALYYDIKSGSFDQGGSTITMQLAKNLYTSGSKNIERKLRDIYYAYKIEEDLNKDQILEAYLNSAGFSKGTVGVQAASKTFFGKDVSKLSLAECALIAGITNYPEKYTPYNRVKIESSDNLQELQIEMVPIDPSVNPNDENTLNIAKQLFDMGKIDNFDYRLVESNQLTPMKAQFNPVSLERQHKILKAMLQQGKISKEDFDAAMNETINLNLGVKQKKGISSYYVESALDESIKILESLGYSQEEANAKIYKGGLKIHTVMDTKVQKSLEDTVSNPSLYPRSWVNESGDPQPQIGSVIIENGSNKIVALVGGRGVGGGRNANRALIPRSPGSSIKPIGPYLAAFNHGATAGDVYLDSNLKYVNLPYITYKPTNVGSYRGWQTIRQLLVRSSNVGTYLVSRDINTDFNDRKNKNSVYSQHVNDDKNFYSIMDTLESLGITTVDRVQDIGYSLSLGGMYRGISPLEMAGAYTVFPNKGIFKKPYMVSKILTNSGEVIYEHKMEEKEVTSPQNAYILTDILKEVVRRGTGTNARVPGMTTAGKTGTTNQKKEAWFVGFTPYYTCSVMLANDRHESLGFSSDKAATVFRHIMTPIHEGLENEDFEKPDGIYRKYVNGYSEMFAENTKPRNVQKLSWYDDEDEDEDKDKDSSKKKNSSEDNNNDSKRSKKRKSKNKDLISDENNSSKKKKRRKAVDNNNENR